MIRQLQTDALRSIVYFVTAARHRSFTDAAEELGISKSALGKSIAKLEAQLNTSLFHRTTRKLSLTTEGEAYLASCQSALDTLAMAEQAVQSKIAQPSGRVRIDMPAAFGKKVMMPILLKLTEQFPELKFTMTFNDKVVDPIDAGFDLAIRFGLVKDSAELVAKALNPQQLVIVASPEYLARFGQPNSLDELSHHRCIVGWRGGRSLHWLLKAPDGSDQRFHPTPFHQISDGDAMIEACIAGAGLMQFPESLLRPMINANLLTPVLKELQPSSTELNIVWPKTRHLMPAVRFIVDHLTELSAQQYFG